MPRTAPKKKVKKARRYPVGEQPTYDGCFLSFESRDTEFHRTKANLLAALLRWRGDVDGMHLAQDVGGFYPIPSILLDGKEKLKAVQQDFKDLKQKAVNEGRGDLGNGAMPLHLFDRQLMAEAQIDAARAKVTWLEGLLALQDEDEEKVRISNILSRGPCGSGKLGGGVLKIIDGQRVGVLPDGLLFINEPESPYNGFHVTDYRTLVVNTWGPQMSKFRAQKMEFERACDFSKQVGQVFDGEKPARPPWPMPKDVQLVEEVQKKS